MSIIEKLQQKIKNLEATIRYHAECGNWESVERAEAVLEKTKAELRRMKI